MANAWTRRLAALAPTVAGAYDLYSPPAGASVVIRDVLVANYEPSPTDIRVFVQSGDKQYDLLSLVAVPALETRHLDVRQELLEGETLRLYVSLPPCSVLVTGYVFSKSGS